MKTKLLLLLLVTALNTRADLAIYNFTGTQTVVGDFVETTLHPHGLLIWDVDNGTAWQIAAFELRGSKQFVIVDQSNSTFFQAAGKGERTFTAVLSSSNSPSAKSSSFTFGLNAKLTLRPGSVIWLPRTARATGFAINLPGTGSAFFGPASLFYSYARTQSINANLGLVPIAGAVEQARQRFVSRGYTQVN